MKTKITYLLLILPLLIFAQGPWEFNGSNAEGWIVSHGSTSTSVAVIATGSAIEYTTITGNSATARNPKFTNASANIDATTNNQIEISLKNGSGATYLRLTTTIGSVVTTYNSVITAGDTDYKIYKFTYDTPGTISSLSLEFKLSDGTTSGNNYVPLTTNTVGTKISIDYIRPKNFIAPIKNTFNFDSTTESFTTLTRATAVQSTETSRGTLKINCTTAASTNAKVALSLGDFRVEGTNKYAHIILKNTSTNTLFQLNGKATVLGIPGVGTAFNPIQTYTSSDSDYKAYDFDLTTWDSGSQFPELNFGVKDTWLATPTTYAQNDEVISSNSTYKNLTGINTLNAPRADIIATTAASTSPNWILVGTEGALLDLTNFIYIDSIVFDNTLGSADFGNTNNTISLYPNPAQEVLNISSSNSIVKIEVYDLLGKKVASNNNASNVNVAALGKGVYIVKVVQENESVIAKQFIKE